MSDVVNRTADVAHLFEFLRDVQRLRVKPVVTLAEYTSAGGAVFELEALPTGYGVDVTGLGAADSAVSALTVPRIATTAAPEPPDEIRAWLTGSWHTPTSSAALVASLSFPDLDAGGTSALEVHEEALADHPEVSAAFDSWQAAWTAWADHEKATKPTRDLYQRLYVARETLAAAAQDWELVLAVGRLRWSPADRHILVQPAHIDLNDTTGALSVIREDVFVVEQDMLSPEQLPGADVTSALGTDLDAVFDEDVLAERLTAYVNRLDARGAFGERPSDPSAPWMRLAPTVILRKRSRMGLVEALDQIAQYLKDADEVPEGLLPLVDPDALSTRTSIERPREDGAVHWQDTDYFLPLPVNAQQFEVIRRVDYQPLTLVQGPPGTGKTHTTAALISHLLAQGKRVLVTAQTDQALHEVRDKLPTEIQDLAVSVLGTSQAERALLTRSVSVLAERAHHHSQSGTDTELSGFRSDLDDIGKRRATTRKKLLELRESDVAPNTIGPYRGTRAQIAEQVNGRRDQFEWTLSLLPDDLAETSLLTQTQWRELLGLLRDPAFEQNLEALTFVIPDVAVLATRAEFATQVAKAQTTSDQVDQLAASKTHPAYPALTSCDPERLSSLSADVAAIAGTMQAWADRDEPWIAECLGAIVTDKASSWVSRKGTIDERLRDASRLTDAIGDEHTVVLTGPASETKVMAQTVLAFLKSGESIRTDPLGKPKLGMFTAKTIKACAPLFATSTVDGRPPITEVALTRLTARIELDELLAALDVAWPSTVVPPEDTLAERLAWHRAEADLLSKVLEFGTQVDTLKTQTRTLAVPDIDWRSREQVTGLLEAIRLIETERDYASISQPLEQARDSLLALDTPQQPAPLARDIAEAIRAGDVDAYGTARTPGSPQTAVSTFLAKASRFLAASSMRPVPSFTSKAPHHPSSHTTTASTSSPLLSR